MKRALTILMIAAAVALSGCGREESFTAPAFLHIDAFRVVPPAQNAVTLDEGFYTADIVAAVVFVHRKGSLTLDTIGHFRLPMTAPVLIDGEVDYMEVFPAVEQSGSSKSLTPFPAYKYIRINDTAFHSGDTMHLDTLTTTYSISRSDVLAYEMFEPTEGSLLFDSVMQWRPQAQSEACTGRGYGFVNVPDTVSYVPFYLDRDFYVSDETKNLYMELDSRSDVEFEVLMESAVVSGSNTTLKQVMRIRPSEEWVHIYVNLGRTWSEFSHNPKFRLHFRAYNLDGAGGEVRLDNVKLYTFYNSWLPYSN